jgi:hypothetical protein
VSLSRLVGEEIVTDVAVEGHPVELLSQIAVELLGWLTHQVNFAFRTALLVDERIEATFAEYSLALSALDRLSDYGLTHRAQE